MTTLLHTPITEKYYIQRLRKQNGYYKLSEGHSQ